MDIDKHWNFSDPEASEAAFRALLPSSEVADRPDLGLELETQIARAQGLQGKYDEAHDTLDGVEARLPGSADRTRVRARLERGRVHNSAGSPAEALPFFQQALDLARAAGEEGLAVDAAHMMAIADREQALEWNEVALELARSSEDPDARRWLASLYNNIGWTRHDRGEFDAALALFEDALALRIERGEAERARVARWCVGRTLRSLGRLEEALTLQRSLLEELEAAGQADGFVNEELGELLLALGRGEEAKPDFARAWVLLSSDRQFVQQEQERLARLNRLGGLGF